MARPRKFNKQAIAQFAQKNTRATKPSTSAVLAVLCHYSGDNLLAWPSVETIANETKLSDRTVRYALKDLRELGEIIAVKPGAEIHGKFGRSTCYYIRICSDHFQHTVPDKRLMRSNLQSKSDSPAKLDCSNKANLQFAMQPPTNTPAKTAPEHKETVKSLHDELFSDDFFSRFCVFLVSHHANFAHNWLSRICDATIVDDTLCIVSQNHFSADQFRSQYADRLQHAAKLAGGVFKRFEVNVIQGPTL